MGPGACGVIGPPFPGRPEIAKTDGTAAWQCWRRDKGPPIPALAQLRRPLTGSGDRFDVYPDTRCRGVVLSIEQVPDTSAAAKWACLQQAHCSGFRAKDSDKGLFELFTNLSVAAPKRGHTCWLAHTCKDFGCQWLHDNKEDHKLHHPKPQAQLHRNEQLRRDATHGGEL